MTGLPDTRPTWADAFAAIKDGQQPLVDLIQYLVIERSELLADNERLRIDVYGCNCPAPCPHSEPLARAVGRLTTELAQADLNREKQRQHTAERTSELIERAVAAERKHRDLRRAARRVLGRWDDCVPPANLDTYMADAWTQLRATLSGAAAAQSGATEETARG